MLRRSLLGTGLAVLALSVLGCTNSWHVITQANPDPFVGQTTFGLLPIDYENLHLSYYRTEAQYLSKKSTETQQSLQADKEALNEEFTKALIEGARGQGIKVTPASGSEASPFTIRPYVTFLEPGFYAAYFHDALPPSRVVMSLRITTPAGQVLEEIRLEHSTPATESDPSSNDRLRADGAGLGKTVARYLSSRVRP
jgi:hypothetical protein